MKNALFDIEAQLTQHQKEITDVAGEQMRIRENMKTVSADTDYYKRLVKSLKNRKLELKRTKRRSGFPGGVTDAAEADQ